MKINPAQISKALSIYNSPSSRAREAAKNNGTPKKDRVDLSKTAQAFQLALEAVKKSPDIRMDKVREIKARMNAGLYRVSSDDIAEKIIEGALFDKKV